MWSRIGPIPTYGIMYLIGIMLILLLLFAKLPSERWQGTKLLWFVIVYGLGRAATDFLRGDTEGHAYLGLFSLTQLICVLAAADALALLVLLMYMRKLLVQPIPGSC